MTALFSVTIHLGLTLSLVLSGCSIKTGDNSPSNHIGHDTASSITRQPNSTHNSGNQKDDLTKIYSQAIGDYIRLVNEEYKLTFDTLFFGKHANGQATDFPDIELPSSIASTKIKLISPEQGEEHQQENKTSFYINLIGSAYAHDADFIFVAFSNGFAHQFDCFITYTHDPIEKEFVIETARFENYRYKTK
jgi:hypothetical protein